MAHVKSEDFDYLTSVDLKTSSKKPFALGLLPLRDISTTPYGAHAIVLADEKWSKAPKTVHIEENVSPIYTDVLNAASTSNSNPEVLQIISQVVAKHDEIGKRFHEEHMKKMFEELKANLMSVQANANVQEINAGTNAGTSNMNPIVLSASTNRNNLSEAANISNSPGHLSSEPMRCSLFQDHIGVSATPNFPSSHINNNIQVEIPNIILRQLSVLQQVLETEKSPSPLKFGTTSEIKLGCLPGNNGTVSKPLQTEHSKQDQSEQEHTKEANLTPALLSLKALGPLDSGRVIEPTPLDFQHQVNSVPASEQVEFGNKQQSAAVSVLNESPIQMTAGCSGSPFPVHSNPNLENLVPSSSRIVIEDDSMSKELTEETNANLGDGIEITMKYADDILIPRIDKSFPKDPSAPEKKSSDAVLNISGPSTIDKRNRKKRKAKVLSPEEKLSKLTVEPHVQEFYKKFLGNKYYKYGNNPTVISINGFPMDYNSFYHSLKAIGNVDNGTFNAYVQVFNYDNDNPDPKSKEPSKFCFTSYFTEKLLVDPKNFNLRSCLRELKKLISANNIHKRDLLYFPRVDSFHWTLFCINNLFETVNFFDSTSSVPQNQINKLTSNLIINAGTLFKSSGLSFKNVEDFECISPENYPQQDNL